MSVISNRKAPFRRDLKGRKEWYDTLLSYSQSSTRPQLLIKDVGLKLKYSSGTVVALCGSILEHRVSVWGVGNRVCYTHFLRESVREHLDVAPAGWVYQNIYLSDWPVDSLGTPL
jgi:hypothetical protein